MISLCLAALLGAAEPLLDDAGEADGGFTLDEAVADAGSFEDSADAGPLPEEAPAAPALEPDAGTTEKVQQTIVVGTSEERTAGSVHIIKSSKLNRFELDDAMAVLQAVPGVYVRGEDGFGLRPNIGLRGANSDRSKKVTLMEDGVLFGPAPYSAPAAYYFPLVTRMESVRVVKGPSAVLYGPATVGGAIDFITRDIPSGIGAGADLGIGQYGYGKLHGWFGASDEHSGFLLEALHLRSDGFKQLDGGGNTGFGRTELMAKGRHVLWLGKTKHTFTAKFTFSAEDSNETYLGLTDADFAQNPLRRYAASALDHMSTQRQAYVLGHRLDVGDVTLTTTAYRHDYQRIWHRFDHFHGTLPGPVLASPGTPRNAIYYGVLTGAQDTSTFDDQLVDAINDRRFLSTGVQLSLRVPFSTGPVQHAVEVTARYHYDTANRHHTGDVLKMEAGKLVSANAPVEELLSNVEDTHAVALSAIDAARWGPVTLTPGVRLELMRSRSNDRLADTLTYGRANALLPGIGAHWAITDHLGVLAGAYRGFSPPAPGQTVTPEYSVNYEAGARWARRGERLEVVGFFNDYSNLTDSCTQSSGCSAVDLDTQFSAGAAHIYGLEVYGEKTFRFGQVTLPLSVAYTLTKTALKETFDSADPQLGNVTSGDELPYVPLHQLNVSAGIDVWRVSAYAQLNFIDRMREVAGQGEAAPGELTDAVLTLDTHVGFKVFDWASLYFDARNLTDTRAIVARRPFGARPNAPRTLIVGLKLSY